ncbi:transposase, partial [Desulfobulbus sp. F5]|nr:transposase [Desulfobulbus sp. F5]
CRRPDKARQREPDHGHCGRCRSSCRRLPCKHFAPHRRGRKKPKTQDGRKLRRYKRRWKVERLFAWLQNFRRLVVRYERHLGNFLAFLQLACSVILLRFILR